MFSKNAVAMLALVPLAVLTLLPHVGYASPVGPDLHVRGDFPPALRRDWDGLDMMQKRGKSGNAKTHGKDDKKSQRDFADDYDLVKRGGKGGKKAKQGRDYDEMARANEDSKSAGHKDDGDGKSHTSVTVSKTKTRSSSGVKTMTKSG